MTLILPQLYMPSRGAAGPPTFITSVAVSSNTLSLPGTVGAGDLCILTCSEAQNGSSGSSSIDGTFTLLGNDGDSTGGPRQITNQLEYRVLTAADITNGTITSGLGGGTSSMIALFYDLQGLSVNTAGNITTATSSGPSINVSASFSGQSGPAFWVCSSGCNQSSTNMNLAHTGFIEDQGVTQAAGGASSEIIVDYQASGAGPTGNLEADNPNDVVAAIAAYITLS